MWCPSYKKGVYNITHYLVLYSAYITCAIDSSFLLLDTTPMHMQSLFFTRKYLCSNKKHLLYICISFLSYNTLAERIAKPKPITCNQISFSILQVKSTSLRIFRFETSKIINEFSECLRKQLKWIIHRNSPPSRKCVITPSTACPAIGTTLESIS